MSHPLHPLVSAVPDNMCEEHNYTSLFRSSAGQLRNFLVYKFRQVDLAEDVVQEAFTILWENCVKVLPANAKAYLYTVAQNAFLKKLEKAKVRAKHDSQLVEVVERHDPAFQMQYAELAQQLQAAIELLPDGQREVFLLNRMDKMTYQQIADLLQVSVKSVEKRMHKALLKLREVCAGI